MDPLNPKQWGVLLAVARRVVPEVGRMDLAGQSAFRDVVAYALNQRDEGLRRQFRLFLTVISALGVVRYGRPFARLPEARQDAILRWLQEAPAARLAAGFWGLKTVIFMGYYSQEAVAPTIGYTPSFAGNERLHA